MTVRRKTGRQGARRPERPSPRVADPAKGRFRISLTTAILLAVVSLAVASLSVYLVMRPKHPSAVARMASQTSPEVAALLYEADRIARDIVEAFPADPHAFHVLAWLHSRYGDIDQAVHYWHHCLTLDPTFDKAHHSIGVIVEATGDHVTAAEHFRMAAELDPQSPIFPVYYARAVTRQGDLEQGAAILERFVQSRPSSVAAMVTLGETYIQLSEFEKAREILERAVELTPDLASPYYGLGTACARLGDHTAAKQYMEKFRVLKARDEQIHRDDLQVLDNIDQVRGDVAWVLTESGKVYLARGDFDSGQQHLQRAIELDPNHVPGHRALAWLYEQQDRIDRAVDLLKALADRVPDDLALLLDLGELCERAGRIDEAQWAYQKALESTPHSPGAYVALANLLVRTGRHPDQARQLAERAVAIDPKGSHFALLSAACQQDGDRPAALAAIERAMALEPSNRQYRILHAAIQSEMNDG